MASRSKKKNRTQATNSKAPSPRLIEAQNTIRRLDGWFPYVVIALVVLISVCFCLPVTGISAKIDLSDDGDESAVYQATSSVNNVSLLFASITMGEGGWIDFLANGLSGSNNQIMQEAVSNYIDANFTSAQVEMLDKALDLQHAVSFVFVALWVIITIVGVVAAYKKSSPLLLAVLCGVFFVLSLAELITLMVISLQGIAGSSFVTGVGAYLLPIVLLGATILLARWQITRAQAKKVVAEEENR
ncbi:MAG: hypothetical protein ACI4MI_01315 [Christensenellales bacterium]